MRLFLTKLLICTGVTCLAGACWEARAFGVDPKAANLFDGVEVYIIPAKAEFGRRLPPGKIEEVACKAMGGAGDAAYLYEQLLTSVVSPGDTEDVAKEASFLDMRIEVKFLKAGSVVEDDYLADSRTSRATLPGNLHGKYVVFNHSLPTYIRSWASSADVPKTYAVGVNGC